ncbi:MAG: FtsX-like permease family protein [Clostridium sp.]
MKNYIGLVNKNIKNDKRSVVPIFLSIILTISLITSVVFITQNIINNKFEEKKLLFGDYDIRFQNLTSEKLNKLKVNENVKDYALGQNTEELISKSQGNSEEDTCLNYIGLYAVEKKFLDEYVTLNVIEGRLPENKNEIVLNKNLLSSLKGKYGVGSTVEFNKRERNFDADYPSSMEKNGRFNLNNVTDVEGSDKETQERINKDIKIENDVKVNYTIVGIIDTPKSDKLFGDKAIRLLSDEEIASSTNKLESFTYLKDPSKEEEVASEIGVKYILPTLTMRDPFGYPAAEVKYPGYDKDSYSAISKNSLARTIMYIVIAFCFTAVYNTFHASVANRIKVYGILRAIGGSMKQIRKLIFTEALVLYLGAAPIGLILGYIITKIESYLLINTFGLLEKFTIDFNLEVVLITLISVFLIIFIAVRSVLNKEGSLTPIEAIIDARGLTRKKKSLGKNILGQNIIDFGSEEKDIAYEKAVIEFEKTTVKFKIMKRFFKFEGELSHKNITRDAKSHRLTKTTLFIAMATLIFFFLQVVNGNINAKNIIKSDKWDLELSLNGKDFDNNVINEIKDTSGVENVYKWSGYKLYLIMPNDKLSSDLKNVLITKPYTKIYDKKDTQAITASITTLDDNSIKFYKNINKEDLDNGGVLTVNKSTTYIKKINPMPGGVIDYYFINSNPTLISKNGDKLLMSEDENVLTSKGLEKYYTDDVKAQELNIVGSVDDDILYSTFKSTIPSELDCDVKLITTEEGLKKITGAVLDNRLIIKTTKDEIREDTISELNKISANNNYELKDIVGNKLRLERNTRQDLGLNIIFAITIVIMVLLNLINTSNASILARRKELASMRALGMSNAQEKKMIVGELFYISLSVAFTTIFSVGFLSIATQSANLGAGKVNIGMLLLGEGIIIISLMIISTLTALGPLAKAKKFSIVEDLKED